MAVYKQDYIVSRSPFGGIVGKKRRLQVVWILFCFQKICFTMSLQNQQKRKAAFKGDTNCQCSPPWNISTGKAGRVWIICSYNSQVLLYSRSSIKFISKYLFTLVENACPLFEMHIPKTIFRTLFLKLQNPKLKYKFHSN